MDASDWQRRGRLGISRRGRIIDRVPVLRMAAQAQHAGARVHLRLCQSGRRCFSRLARPRRTDHRADSVRISSDRRWRSDYHMAKSAAGEAQVLDRIDG